jgi:hypothetical protein
MVLRSISATAKMGLFTQGLFFILFITFASQKFVLRTSLPYRVTGKVFSCIKCPDGSQK